jgi:23S rRNA pseudouridine1911/1915/1917 synthase
MQKLPVNEESEGRRLDAFISEALSISRAQSKQLITQASLKVNGSIKKASYLIQANDNIEVELPKEIIPSKIDFEIIYEDEDCIVIDKPIGVLSHSKGSFNDEYTVSKFVEDKIGKSDNDRTGIVHRLDRSTSGVMICSKNEAARVKLQRQFSDRKVKKTYHALIQSGLTPRAAIIDMPIERNPKDPKRFRAGFGGKSATTKYEIKIENEKFALVELKPETGRTHQLRVHLAKLGYPIIGDDFYTGLPSERLFLHASELEITTPDSQRRTFKSQLPKEFNDTFKVS